MENVKYGKLTFIWKTERKSKLNKRIYWMFKCECWSIKEMVITNVTLWKSTSCWCYKPQKTHWMNESKIYQIYRAIIQRCNNKNNKSYYNYWWRWIKCEWNTFEEFYKDMWDTYKEWLTIDRTDNNWNYCKDNCKWVTMENNQRNKRTNVYFKWKCLAQWGKENGIDRSTISKRISKWWSIEDAVNIKPRKRSK